MKCLFALRDNAMFSACYRQRMRPGSVLGALILLVVIVAVAALYSSANRAGNYYDVLNDMLIVIYSCQIVILLLGAVRLSNLVRQERVSGTLDFHRVSPQNRLDIVKGLLFGAPILEWILALTLLPAFMLMGISWGLPLLDLVTYELALFLAVLAAGQFFMVLVLLPGEERLKASGPVSFGGIVFVGVFLVASYMPSIMLFDEGQNTFSPSYYAFTPYFFWHVVQQVYGQETPDIPLPVTFGIQAAVQIPLLCFGVWVAVRRLKYPERPLFSKAQAFTLVFLAFGLYLAEVLNNFAGQSEFPELILGIAVLAAFMGLFGAFMVSPNRLLVIRGKYLDDWQGQMKWRNLVLSDSASNLFWLVGYSMLTFVTVALIWFLAFAGYLGQDGYRYVLFLFPLCGFIIAQVACFGGLYEVFLLGRFHKSVSLFSLFVFLFWIAFPALGLILGTETRSGIYWSTLVLSPVYAPLSIISLATENGFTQGLRSFLQSGTVMNIALALIFFAFVRKLRKQLL